MRTFLSLAVTALMMTAGAGCVGSEAPSDDAAATAPAAVLVADEASPADAAANLSAADFEVDAPVPWRVGDAWEVTLSMGDTTDRAVIAVASATSDAYEIVTTNDQVAAYDAMFDVSYVGRVRAGDLAGAQQGSPVQFFSFPLVDGKTWTAKWDGRDIKLTATFSAAIPTPEGPQPGYHIQGKDGEEPYVSYDYVPAVGWWTHLDFAAGYGFRVDRVLHNWTGSYKSATAATVFEGEVGSGFSPNAGAFSVDEGQTFVALTISGAAPAYARALVLTDPAGQPVMTTTPNTEASPEPSKIRHHERFPPTPGEWHIASPFLHHPDGAFSVLVQQVAIVDKTLVL